MIGFLDGDQLIRLRRPAAHVDQPVVEHGLVGLQAVVAPGAGLFVKQNLSGQALDFGLFEERVCYCF